MIPAFGNGAARRRLAPTQAGARIDVETFDRPQPFFAPNGDPEPDLA